ncbi:growth-regulating factor 8-like isoform X1 [Primulina eburnea]|uniref:growth-regulating factor 8-like isoform X1 n=1 Tax=Primulina eburnea TaxID=1245227 RepID=UPI003C6C5A71
MEKGANNSSGFCGSDKKSSFATDVCLMKLQGTEPSFPSKICIHEKSNLHHFSGFVGDDGGGGGRSTCGGGLGPSGGGANEVVANIYLDNVSTSGGCAEKITSTSLQPFEVFPYCSTTRDISTGGMAASVRFPFTFSQWKELERQAMIYKYMIASVPVPADLLFPLSRNFPDSCVTCIDKNGILYLLCSKFRPFSLCFIFKSYLIWVFVLLNWDLIAVAGGDGMYSASYSKKGDPEPGRCKRTDGKKWRCSRDVAPQQKYCERHLHRGRPRSRKPVEVKNNAETQKKARLEQIPLPTTVKASNDASQQFATAYQPHFLYNTTCDLSVSTPSSKGNNRDMSLMIESGMATSEGNQLQLQHLMEAHVGVTNESSPIYNFHQDYPEQQLLNLLPYSNLSATENEAPSRFIDAWSTDNLNRENVMDRERRNVVAGSDVKDFDGHQPKDDPGNSSPASWEPFARGGPLAEALQLGSLAIGESNPASPYRSISTPATSPSGVNYRTLFSNSDSSVCNSPTLAAPPSEVTFHWLN